MDKILKGVLRYNVASKAKFKGSMEQYANQNLRPLTVVFTCMDSRVLPSKFVDAESGQIFFVRNAGNMVPDYELYRNGIISTEGAALELGCVVNDIDNVMVCGHSDCKAVNLVYDVQHACDHKKYHLESPLKTWCTLHGKKSLNKLLEAVSNKDQDSEAFNEPLVCSFNIGNEKVTAHIDPENKFDIKDKLSQIHCLQQASHVSTYPFLTERLKSGALRVSAMWFDVQKGDVYFFSPKLQQFLMVDDDTVQKLP